MTLREFINANGGQLMVGTLPNQNFCSIKAGDCYLAFAKKMNISSEADVTAALKSYGADGLDVLVGQTNDGKTCHTLVPHMESALKVFNF